jgi:UDP-glucose 4-epimerase
VILESVRAGVERFIYASTGGAIYGEPERIPADEQHPVNPLAPYGVSKHTVEHYLRMYEANEGLRWIALRYANVYGPRQDPHGEAGVVAIFIGRMLAGERPRIFGLGTATRDYVYVGDVVAANEAALRAEGNGVYNIGTGIQTSVLEIVAGLNAILGTHLEPEFADFRPGEVERIALDAIRAERELGWRPTVSFGDGLRLTADWFRGQER